LGAGTTFYIYIPKSEKELSLEEKKGKGELLYGKGKILIMDDEEILRNAAGLLLDELGYNVGFARDGKEAIEIYKALNCFDLARLDFIWPKDSNEIYFIEINTIPGMTKTSLVPKAAKAAGVNFKDLLDKIIEMAQKRYLNEK